MPWTDVVRAVSAVVAAGALVAIALAVRETRDFQRRQDCMAGQAIGFTGSFEQNEYVDALRACGYDAPGDGDDDQP